VTSVLTAEAGDTVYRIESRGGGLIDSPTRKLPLPSVVNVYLCQGMLMESVVTPLKVTFSVMVLP
jgi:hypothetical protein